MIFPATAPLTEIVPSATDRDRTAHDADRTLFAHDQVPLCGGQLSLGRDLKISVSGESQARGGLYLKKTRSLHGEIQVVAGVLQVALGQVHLAAARDSKIVDCLVQARTLMSRRGCKERPKDVLLRPISRRAGVCEVVGHQVKRLTARHQRRTCRIESAVHRRSRNL